MENETSPQSVNLLEIPEEIYRYIFRYLHQNDLLRLRRTCKQIQLYADGYIRNHCDQEREINETNFTLDDFRQVNFPTCRVYLNNSGPKFFQNPHIYFFRQLYTHEITHLRVKHFSTCISEPENRFYLALTNLQHLELEFIDARRRRPYKIVNGVQVARETYFPITFKNLKTLKLGEIKGSDKWDLGYGRDFMEYCTEVEYLRHPFYKSLDPGSHSLGENGPFSCIIDLIEKRLREEPNEPLKLKYYDIGYVEEKDMYWVTAYCNLAQICFDNKIKLLNVHAPLLQVVLNTFHNNYHKFAESLVSVRNLHASLFHTELPNLEKLIIGSTGESNFYNSQENLVQWPRLEVLDITVDSEKTCSSFDFEEEETVNLLNYLFNGMDRTKLKDLRIRFDKKTHPETNTIPCPRVTDIVQTCKNVTKLTLTNWMTNKTVSKFWAGLLHLEEVTLEECKLLHDEAFVGSEKNDPTFLRLKKLKKFTLRGLELMPYLTDRVFETIFCHLRVKQFHLISRKPVKSITIKGICSLVNGEFNNFVEKFPFTGWSLENISEEHFYLLKSKFRASHML